MLSLPVAPNLLALDYLLSVLGLWCSFGDLLWGSTHLDVRFCFGGVEGVYDV